jgi:hypothetical protein
VVWEGRNREAPPYPDCYVQIAPQSRVFVFAVDSQSSLGRDDQLAAFKAKEGVTSSDHLVVVAFH